MMSDRLPDKNRDGDLNFAQESRGASAPLADNARPTNSSLSSNNSTSTNNSLSANGKSLEVQGPSSEATSLAGGLVNTKSMRAMPLEGESATESFHEAGDEACEFERWDERDQALVAELNRLKHWYDEQAQSVQHASPAASPWNSGQSPLSAEHAVEALRELGIDWLCPSTAAAPKSSELIGECGDDRCETQSESFVAPRSDRPDSSSSGRQGLALPSGVLAIVAALALLVTSFVWGRAEGWKNAWQVRAPQIAKTFEPIEPGVLGLAHLSTLPIPVACRTPSSSTESSSAHLNNSEETSHAVGALEGIVADYRCCTQCHFSPAQSLRVRSDESGTVVDRVEMAGVASAARLHARGLSAIVASCSACHQLSRQVCERSLPVPSWGESCRECHGPSVSSVRPSILSEPSIDRCAEVCVMPSVASCLPSCLSKLSVGTWPCSSPQVVSEFVVASICEVAWGSDASLLQGRNRGGRVARVEESLQLCSL